MCYEVLNTKCDNTNAREKERRRQNINLKADYFDVMGWNGLWKADFKTVDYRKAKVLRGNENSAVLISLNILILTDVSEQHGCLFVVFVFSLFIVHWGFDFLLLGFIVVLY